MRKISYGQAITLLFICRLLRAMTYNPFAQANSVILIWAMLATTVVQGAMLIPLIYIYKKFPGKSVNELAFGTSKTFGFIVSIIYGLFFFSSALRYTKYFTYFMMQMFPNVGGRIIVSSFIIIIAGYGACLGIEAIARSSASVMVLFFIMVAFMLLTSQGGFELTNLNMAVENPWKTFITCFIEEIGMNTELVFLAVLLPYISSRIDKMVAIFLSLKLVVIELIIFIYTTVLGEYIRLVPLPFFAFGAYSKTRFIERFDALYMVEWTLCAVIAISLAINCCGRSVQNMLVKFKLKYICIWIALCCLALSVPFRLNVNLLDRVFDRWLNSVMVILLVLVIPLACLLSYKKNSDKAGG